MDVSRRFVEAEVEFTPAAPPAEPDMFNLEVPRLSPSTPAPSPSVSSCPCVLSTKAKIPAKDEVPTSTPGSAEEILSFHDFSSRYCLIFASLRVAGSVEELGFEVEVEEVDGPEEEEDG